MGPSSNESQEFCGRIKQEREKQNEIEHKNYKQVFQRNKNGGKGGI